MATPKQIDKLRTAAQVGVTISGATLIPAKMQDGTEAFKMSITELSPFLTDKGLRIGTTGIISASLQDVKDAAATNTGIKLSNATFEYTGIFTFASKTASTLIYLNASKQVTSLVAGTDGQVLTLASGLPSWASPASGIEINVTPITSGTAGRLLFESATNKVSETANLFWDISNNRLGIGTSSPSRALTSYVASGSYNMRLESGTANLYNEFITTGGTSEYGIFGDALYFQALDSLANGIYFFPNTAGTNGLHILADGSVRHEYSSTVYLSTAVSSTGQVVFVPVGSSASIQICSSTSQKIGFWNTAPVVQPTTLGASATVAHIGGTAMNENDTIGGYTIAQVVQALQLIGILA